MLLKARITTRLQQAEEVIENGLVAYREAGNALREIRDEGLYKQSFDTFEDYCLCRWNWSRPRAYQLIDASVIATNLSTMVDIPNERQARELTKLPTADLQKAAYGVAETIAAQSKAGKVTAKDVRKAVEIVHKVIAENPTIKPKEIAAKAVEHGATADIEPEFSESDMMLDALNTTVEHLTGENERFKNQIAAMLFDGNEADKAEYKSLLDTLTEENRKLLILNRGLIKSRDSAMTELASCKKQCQIYQRKIKSLENAKPA